MSVVFVTTWEMRVAEARSKGATEIAPNRLPITCIRHDGALLEHPEADHAGYIMPVLVEFVGERPADVDPMDVSYEPEQHAALFVGGNVVLTIFECCYSMWRLDSGRHLGGPTWFRDWRIADVSLVALRGRCAT